MPIDPHNRPFWVILEKVENPLTNGFGLPIQSPSSSSNSSKADLFSHIKCTVVLETFSKFYQEGHDFLVAVAEPLSRPTHIHHYQITPYSLYAAVSVGLTTKNIVHTLQILSKNEIDPVVFDFITYHTKSNDKIHLSIYRQEFFLTSIKKVRLIYLLQHSSLILNAASKPSTSMYQSSNDGIYDSSDSDSDLYSENSPVTISKDEAEKYIFLLNDSWAFHINVDTKALVSIKRECVSLNLPATELYHFRQDIKTPMISIHLKPSTHVRPYQEQALAKMFSKGTARSGIIVLPCGAGKTLVGIICAATLGKNTLILCTSTMACKQWVYQFEFWTNSKNQTSYHRQLQADWKNKRIGKKLTPSERLFRAQWKTDPPKHSIISLFLRDQKKPLCPYHDYEHPHYNPDYWQKCPGHIVITTYHMMAYTQARSEKGESFIESMKSHDWGLMLLDEVHRAPAEKFSQVITSIPAQCKLGLTATLVREDNLINDLKYLVGPKLFEANWTDLQQNGYLARVGCFEILCGMDPLFYAAYLNATEFNIKRQLALLNPKKFLLVGFLIAFHETKGDKIIVFSDDVFTLLQYAHLLNRKDHVIYGDTPQADRERILSNFRMASKSSGSRVIFLSKVGDDSIDLPDANCLIQISSQGGSRRQEAQRLGRILRPKPAEIEWKIDDPSKIDDSATGLDQQITKKSYKQKSDFNSYFYTVISKDTHDQIMSLKRQRFLVDQGYSYFVRSDQAMLKQIKSNSLLRETLQTAISSLPKFDKNVPTSAVRFKKALASKPSWIQLLIRLNSFSRPSFSMEILKAIQQSNHSAKNTLDILEKIGGSTRIAYAQQQQQMTEFTTKKMTGFDQLTGATVALYTEKQQKKRGRSPPVIKTGLASLEITRSRHSLMKNRYSKKPSNT